jgi:hypothetical protein
MLNEILIIPHRQIEVRQVVIKKINRKPRLDSRDKITVPLPKGAHHREKIVLNNSLLIIQLM